MPSNTAKPQKPQNAKERAQLLAETAGAKAKTAYVHAVEVLDQRIGQQAKKTYDQALGLFDERFGERTTAAKTRIERLTVTVSERAKAVSAHELQRANKALAAIQKRIGNFIN